MADRKITELTAMSGGTQAAGDLLTIVDVSEAAAVDKNKKITLQNLFEAIPGDVGIVGGTDVRLELGTTGTTNTNNRNHVRGDGSSLKYNTCSGGSHSFEQNGTERLRVDSSGRLLVGSSSTREVGYGDNASLQLEGTSYPKAAISSILNSNNANGPSINFAKSRGTSNGTSTVVQNNDILGLIAFSGGDGTDIRTMGARIQASVDGTPGANDMPGRLVFSTTSDGASSPTERMRIRNDGTVLVGGTTVVTRSQHVLFEVGEGSNSFDIQRNNGSNVVEVACQVGTVSGRTIQNFINPNGSVGGISINDSTTTFETSSDYRLKENIVDLTGGINRIKQLSPRRFNFIANANKTVDGFIAHEAQTIVPEAVRGAHNEVDDDGNAVMQGIDQSKLVPLLTAALQEAIAKIETLETKVEALEAG